MAHSKSDWMIGGLAQLVERLLCKQDVSGSSPLTSTDPNLKRHLVGPKGFNRMSQVV